MVLRGQRGGDWNLVLYEAFLRGSSRKNRHEIRRHERKLADDFSGKVRIHCYQAARKTDGEASSAPCLNQFGDVSFAVAKAG
jgi:hypothetical protein